MSVRCREMFRYEYKRLFSRKLWLWIGICFLLNLAGLICKYRENEDDFLYREIVEQYRGVSTEEKISDIYEKTAHYILVLENHAAVAEEYARGNVSDKEFQQFIADYKYAERSIDSWVKVQEKAGRFAEQGKTTYFFYDTAWEKLFENNADWIFLFLLMTLLVPYFYLDRDSDLYGIAKSYANYQRMEQYRLYGAVAVVLFFRITGILSELLVILSVSSLPDALSTVCSLEKCRNVGASVTLLQFYIVRNLLLLLKSVVDVFLLKFMSEKIRNKMQTTIILLIYLAVTNFYCIELLKGI